MNKDFQRVMDNTSGLALHGLDKPVALAIEKLDYFFQISWWVNSDALPALSIVLPTEQQLKIDWAATLAEGQQKGCTITVACSDSQARWDQMHRMTRLGAVFSCLPDESQLEFCIDGTLPLRATGPVRQGQWFITQLSRPISASVLERVLELARQSSEENGISAASIEIAQKAEQTLRAEWSLEEDKFARQANKLVLAGDDNASYYRMFAGHIFLHDPEFCQVFGLDKVVEKMMEELEEELREMQNFQQTLNLNLANVLGVAAGATVYKGKKASFDSTDSRKVRWLTASEIDMADEEFLACGFESFGDLNANGTVVRGFACQAQDCWGVITISPGGQFLREFYSYTKEGPHLTTTSLPFAQERPSQKLYKQSSPELETPELLEAHRARLKKEKWTTKPCPPDLATLAKSMDDYLVLWG